MVYLRYIMYIMSKRIILSMPEEFLEAVDAEAEAEHRSRSEFVREALREYMVSRGRAGSAGVSRAEEAARKLAEARHKSGDKAVKGSEIVRKWRYRLDD